MTKKLAFLATAFAILASANPVAAQQTGKVYRIGFLTSGSVEHFKLRLAAFRQGLQKLGYLGYRTVPPGRYVRGQDPKGRESRRFTR